VPTRIGRVRDLAAEPAIDAAVDGALARAGFDVVDIRLPEWTEANDHVVGVMFAEALAGNAALIAGHVDGLGEDLQERFRRAAALPPDTLAVGQAARARWRERLAAEFAGVDLLALPSMLVFPAVIGEHSRGPNAAALAVNLAGHPAIALPVPTGGRLPASLQFVGPDGSEDRLVAAAAAVEDAVGTVHG
jgi:Asp-tRNA(Asn)/Glu-tRNA(Gln) amidotransferase A subunit family amidase